MLNRPPPPPSPSTSSPTQQEYRDEISYIPAYHIRSEPECSLCRAPVDKSGEPRPNQFGSTVFAFFDMTHEDALRPNQFVYLADLSHNMRLRQRSCLLDHTGRRRLLAHVCHRTHENCHTCQHRLPLQIVHKECWHFVRKLYRGFSVRHLKNIPRRAPGSHHRPGAVGSPSSSSAQNTEHVGTRPSPIMTDMSRRLPSELRQKIADGIPDEAVNCLLAAAGAAHTVVPELLLDYDEVNGAVQGLAEVLERGPVWFCSELIQLWDHKYLRRIQVVDDPSESDYPLKVYVSKERFAGIKFSFGLFGLHGVSAVYRDGSTSDWLGHPQDGWLGQTRCDDLSRLQVLRDVGRQPLTRCEIHYQEKIR